MADEFDAPPPEEPDLPPPDAPAAADEALAFAPAEPDDEPVETASPELGPWHACLGCGMVVALFAVVIVVFAVVLIARGGLGPGGTMPPRPMAVLMAAQHVCLILPVLLVPWMFGVPLRVALAWKPAPARCYLLVLVGVVGTMLLSDWLTNLIIELAPESALSMEMINDLIVSLKEVGLAPVGVVLIAAAGLSEELLFRGFMYTGLVRRWAPWVVIVVTAGGFAALHVSPAHVVGVLPVGLYFGLARQRCGSVLPMVVAHTVNNGLLGVLIAAQPGNVTDTLVGKNAAVALAGLVLALATLVFMRREE